MIQTCGAGSKGEHIHDYAVVAAKFESDDVKHKGLLIQRSIDEPRVAIAEFGIQTRLDEREDERNRLTFNVRCVQWRLRPIGSVIRPEARGLAWPP